MSISNAEWEIMRVVWTKEETTSSQILEILEQKTDWTASTVKTLLKRLVDKGYLATQKSGKSFLYSTLVSEEEAIDKMWEAIFHCTRVDQEDPIEAWNQHNKNLKVRMNFLNDSKFKTLYFKSGKTDITMELPEGHIWLGGEESSKDGTIFNANIPTEEVFSAPQYNGVNGIVYSTKPLIYHGNTISDFSFTFKEGKIVDYTAKEGYEVLKELIETDEGSHYLGEVALVDHFSPISQSNQIFYETLFDENASCHLAIGASYPTCLKNSDGLSEEELKERGLNYSLTHVDFMIGDEHMNIKGYTRDGQEVDIMIDGRLQV